MASPATKTTSTNGAAVRAAEPDTGWEHWEPTPGTLYADLEERVYHASRGISKHGLDNIARSPAHYRYLREHPSESSEAMTVGSAIDCLVFEPDLFDERFVVDDTGLSRNSKAWKEWVAETAAGRSILRASQHDKVRGMRDALASHPTVSALLADGTPQPSMYWIDAEPRSHEREPTFRLCRGRLDWLCDGHSVAVDLKKARDARYGKFVNAVRDYRYHVQDAFYRAGLRACGRPVEHFVFIAVEEEPPHGINVFELDPNWQRQGRMLWERDLETYSECMKSQEWPGYPIEPRTLDMPPWAERIAIV